MNKSIHKQIWIVTGVNQPTHNWGAPSCAVSNFQPNKPKWMRLNLGHTLVYTL